MHTPPAASASIGARLQLRAEPAELSTARRFADSAADGFGLDERERYEFTFAVNEAVSNAIEHGRPSPEGTIRLEAGEEDGALVFYVEDYGTFAPSAAGLEVLPERGRGLAFIAAVVDEVDVCRGAHGTVVCLRKRAASRCDEGDSRPRWSSRDIPRS